MSWATHTLLGRECALEGKRTGVGVPSYVLVRWEERAAPDDVPVEVWAHAKPIIHVGTATLPWVSVEDVPHPVGHVGRRWLLLDDDGGIRNARTAGYGCQQYGVTHWCWAEPDAVQSCACDGISHVNTCPRWVMPV